MGACNLYTKIMKYNPYEHYRKIVLKSVEKKKDD